MGAKHTASLPRENGRCALPTTRELHGSDAMHRDPDYSARVVGAGEPIAATASRARPVVHHGRGTEIVLAAVDALATLLVGQPVAPSPKGG